MKKWVSLFCGLILVLCACQPSPEYDAVRQKDTNVLIETVRNDEATQKDTEEEPTDALPERFQLNTATDRGNVRIKADVPIEVFSDTGAFPVLRVERRYLTDDERLTLTKRLLGSETLYLWEYRETREALTTMIREYMREFSPEEKEAWMRETDSTEEDYEELLARRKRLAEQYQKQYNELPPDDEAEPLALWDGTVPEFSADYSKPNEVTIVANATDSGPQWSIDHVQATANSGYSPFTYQRAGRDGGDNMNVWFFNRADNPDTVRIACADYEKPYGDARITPNEAFALVQSYFEGISDFAISDVYWSSNADNSGEVVGGTVGMNQTRYAYVLHLSTVYHGAYQPYCATPAFDDDSTAAYVIPWNYETLTAVVDGDGELLSLVWLSPLTVTETIGEAATLLPYQEIADIFTAQIGRMFTLESEVVVTSVQLGLFRIREKNDMESGLLVPVWYFVGEFRPTNAQTGGNDAFSYDPLLIINAIDGSIINAQNGY